MTDDTTATSVDTAPAQAAAPTIGPVSPVPDTPPLADSMEQSSALLAKISDKDIPPDDMAKLQSQATAIVAKLTTDSEDLSSVSAVDSVGGQTQMTASGFLDRPQSDLNNKSILGPSSAIPAQIEKLRLETDRMNPESIRHNAVFKMLNWVGLGDRAADFLLKEVYEHKDSIRQNIDGITKGLLVTKANGIQNNVELESIDKDARGQILGVRQNLNLLKFMAQELQKRRDAATDDQTKNFLVKLHHRIMMRIQYLMMTEQMLMQYRIGVSVIHEGNMNVVDAIDNLAYIVAKTLPIGLALRIAASDQAKSIQIVHDSQELTIKTLEDTAGAIKQNVDTLSSLISGDLAPMQRLQRTSEVIIGAAEQLKTAYQAGIDNVNKQIPVYDAMRTKVAQYIADDKQAQAAPQQPAGIDATQMLGTGQ